MTQRKALVVGINFYSYISNLFGCVTDAVEVKRILETHGNGTGANFDVRLMVARAAGDAIDRGKLRDAMADLFKDKPEIALLYFAGHGHIEATGGYLCTSECRRGDDGVSLGDVLTFARESKAENKVILLDSCHSGVAGKYSQNQESAAISDGMTILTASTEEQYAKEENGTGVFTGLLVDALEGGAANVVGQITPGSVYAHIDQSLGAWQQRPVFKTNVSRFVSLRNVKPSVEIADLKRLPEFFPTAGGEYLLTPAHEPEPTGRPAGSAPPDPEKTAIFEVLQRFNRVNLVVPHGASKPNMWHAAMESRSCKLTPLGRHYWRLVTTERIR